METERMRPFSGIEGLIKRNSEQRIFTCNVGIPYKGKDRFVVPVPFPMDVYIHEEPGDTMVRLPKGDDFNSLIKIFSLKPIGVPVPPPISDVVTFGFLDSNFTLIYNLRLYRIISQKHINNQYYVMTGENSE
jgi:hypothetical protein